MRPGFEPMKKKGGSSEDWEKNGDGKKKLKKKKFRPDHRQDKYLSYGT